MKGRARGKDAIVAIEPSQSSAVCACARVCVPLRVCGPHRVFFKFAIERRRMNETR